MRAFSHLLPAFLQHRVLLHLAFERASLGCTSYKKPHQLFTAIILATGNAKKALKSLRLNVDGMFGNLTLDSK